MAGSVAREAESKAPRFVVLCVEEYVGGASRHAVVSTHADRAHAEDSMRCEAQATLNALREKWTNAVNSAVQAQDVDALMMWGLHLAMAEEQLADPKPAEDVVTLDSSEGYEVVSFEQGFALADADDEDDDGEPTYVHTYAYSFHEL